MRASGEIVGEHDGYARFTIGQRRGLPGGFHEPMFVVAIRPEERAVVIGPREELLGHGVVARELNWLVEPLPAGSRVQLRVRHRAPLAEAEIVRIDGDEIELALDEPVSAIAPGQSLVLYDGDRVLGGGFIERAGSANDAADRRARRALPLFAA
jgi:tRNA-specific 2-thiouridylase